MFIHLRLRYIFIQDEEQEPIIIIMASGVLLNFNCFVFSPSASFILPFFSWSRRSLFRHVLVRGCPCGALRCLGR